jgi:hypothetical protein
MIRLCYIDVCVMSWESYDYRVYIGLSDLGLSGFIVKPHPYASAGIFLNLQLANRGQDCLTKYC